MTFLETSLLIVYVVLALFSWIVFTCWLHDTKKKELNNSWLGSVVLAGALATVWLISLVMLYFSEISRKQEEEEEEANERQA